MKNNLSDRDSKIIWHPFTQMKTAEAPIAIVKGEGARLYDEAGNVYICLLYTSPSPRD